MGIQEEKGKTQEEVYGLLTLMVCGIIVMLETNVDEVARHQQKTINLQMHHNKND